MTPYASHSRCRVLSCWCVNERSVVVVASTTCVLYPLSLLT